jgi:drug/metabolite transporter (DMT)-like permease
MDDAHRPALVLPALLLTTLAMLAFAANSLLCRLALQRGGIDPATFTSLRLVAGALMLVLCVRGRGGSAAAIGGDWRAALMLFAYAACFSFAYLGLSAGTGALVLFGAVQVTMLIAGMRAGEMFSPLAWSGLGLAIAGLVYLVAPGVTAPPPGSAALMAMAGVAWGWYSLRGRGSADPLAATTGNFLRAAPLALLLSGVLVRNAHADTTGIALAVASGAVTSGLGYVLWYAALKELTAMRAATVQLSVPLIAAFGGVVFLAEAITPRLAVATVLILGGIALALTRKAGRLRA